MWLNYRDANTKYFHLKTIQCRSQSRIVTRRDDIGLWLTRDTLIIHITNAFKKLFRATSAHLRPPAMFASQYSQSSPFLDHVQSLSRIPQLTEVFRNVHALPPLKAPGPDRYHTLFFRKVLAHSRSKCD